MAELTSERPLTAVILAAGQGGRIQRLTRAPKVLLRINDQTLLERHLLALANEGVTDVVIVVGYDSDRIVEHVGGRFPELGIRYAFNDDWLRQGNGYSLWLGIQQAPGAVLVFDGDVIYAEQVLSRFLKAGDDSAMLVGRGDVDDVECAKTLVDKDGWVRKTVDKRLLSASELKTYRFAGEAIGILRFDAATREALDTLARKFFADAAHLALNWEHLLDRIFRDHHVACRLEPSTDWIEIDTPEDFRAAVALFENTAPLSRRSNR